jgi:lysozyme family protein
MSYAGALAHALEFEAGYANHPADNGKETYRGVSHKSWPYWPGWELIDAAKKDGITTAKAINAKFNNDPVMIQRVADFYRVYLWDRVPPEMTGILREKHFDTSINMGEEGAGKVL